MRMWCVSPDLMCRKHLLGEHVEMHMLIGAIKKGKSIQGYVNSGLVNPYLIKARHDTLVMEMKSRGMNHNSPLDYDCSELPFKPVSITENKQELAKRCFECNKLINLED